MPWGPAFSHHIISLDGGRNALSALDTNVDVTFSEAPVNSGGWSRVLFFRGLVTALRPAAVLTYNWGTIEATSGARIASICPVIHNECGFGPDEANVLLRRRVWARRAILNAIFRTVVTSKTLLSIALTQYKLAPGKVQLIGTGVDVNRFHPHRDRFGRENLGATEDDVLFGYVGGLRPEKNLDLLLYSFHASQLPNSKLLLVGEGPCRPELENLVRKLDLQGKVIFAGHHADPAPVLGMLDAFVMSSLTEQVSNAQLEAMASGLPVICTPTSGIAATCWVRARVIVWCRPVTSMRTLTRYGKSRPTPACDPPSAQPIGRVRWIDILRRGWWRNFKHCWR